MGWSGVSLVWLAVLSLAWGGNLPVQSATLKPAVNPFITVEEFPAVRARYVRFTILKSNAREPALDEVAVFTAEDEPRNVALLIQGAQIKDSGSIDGDTRFAGTLVGDGVFGRQNLWIADREADVWVQVEFSKTELINRIEWSRDRTEQQWDRTPIDYRIEVAEELGEWTLVADSSARASGLRFDSREVTRVAESRSVDEIDLSTAPISSVLNIESFPAIKTQRVRFLLLDTGGQRPWLDEIEVFAFEDGVEQNVALAAAGARADSSNSVASSEGVYHPSLLIDGEYGEASQWSADQVDRGWVVIKLRHPFSIHKIQWSRDRTGRYFDGVPLRYRIEVTSEAGDWIPVASSESHRESDVVEFTNHPSLPTDYVIDRWSERDGEPIGPINGLAQTPDGYLWLGTDEALLRFDGSEFVRFDRSNTPALSTKKIYRLYVDRQGRMWILSRKFFYDASNNLVLFERGRFRRIELPSGVRVEAVFEEQNGQVWFQTNQSALPWRDGGIDVQGELSGFDLASLTYLEAGTESLWLGRPGGWRGEEFIPLFGEKGPVLPPDGEFGRRRQFAHRDGGAWIVHGGLGGDSSAQGNQWQLLDSDGALSPPTDFPWVTSAAVFDALHVDGDNQLWIADRQHGLHCLSADGASYESFASLDGLGPGSVRRLLEDQSGNLWIGTAELGLLRLRKRLFRSLGAAQGMMTKSQSAIPDNVYSIAPSGEGGVWIGTHASNAYRWRSDRLASLWNASGATWSILEDSRGTVWTGTYGQGVKQHKGRQWTILPTVAPHAFALFEDSRSRLWMGGDFGISVLEDGVLHRCVPPEFDRARFEWVISLAESQDGAIWVGSKLGKLHRYENQRFATMWSSERQEEFPICTLYEDDTGAMWFARFGSGLSCYREGSITHYTESEGLPSSTINGILDDGLGYLWMSSKEGVFRIAREDFQRFTAGERSPGIWKQFTESDGLPSRECQGEQSQPSLCQTKDGRIWVSTLRGVGVIDPVHAQSYGSAPEVLIQSVTLYGSGGGGTELISGETGQVRDEGDPLALLIPRGNKSLLIRYTAIEYSEPEQVQFSYRILGVDNEWVRAGNERAALVASLDPGEYRFEVRAENHLGRVSEISSLDLSVQPFWWETRTFRILASLGVIAFGAGAYQRRVRSLERRNLLQEDFSRQLIEREESERKRLAQEMHDGLGHELLLVRNRALDGADAPLGEARERFGAISELAAQALENARHMAFNLRPFELDRIGFKKSVEGMIHQLGHAGNTRYFTDVDELEGILPSSSLVNLYRVIQEGMNNIVKHAEASMVMVEIKVEDECVRIQLEDDGRGFKPRSHSLGMGLSGMEERVRLMRGVFQISSVEGKGTRILIRLPC